MQALIFANGDVNDGPMVQRTLASAHDALVVAADGGARVAWYFGLTVHTVIGDMDSLPEADLERLENQGTGIHRYSPEKDETDLELALRWTATQNADPITIIGGIGDRIDQTLANIYLLALPDLLGRDVQMVAGRQAIWLLHPGKHRICGETGDTISLIPMGGAVSGVRTENLYYPLADETLEFGPARGISNRMQTSEASVTLTEGLLLVVHSVGHV